MEKRLRLTCRCHRALSQHPEDSLSGRAGLVGSRSSEVSRALLGLCSEVRLGLVAWGGVRATFLS